MTNAAFLTLSHCEHLLKYTKRAAALTAAAASAALILAASPAAQAKHITVALSAAFTHSTATIRLTPSQKPWHEPFMKGSLLLIKT